MLVCWLVAVTVAFGTALPLASVTTPVMLAKVVCGLAVRKVATRTALVIINTCENLVMLTSTELEIRYSTLENRQSSFNQSQPFCLARRGAVKASQKGEKSKVKSQKVQRLILLSARQRVPF